MDHLLQIIDGKTLLIEELTSDKDLENLRKIMATLRDCYDPERSSNIELDIVKEIKTQFKHSVENA